MKKVGTSIDSLDAQGRQVYDTIAISYHADDFYALDYKSWYFVPGDAIGNCAINGVNFGNNIVDDERFGMRRFVYYNNTASGINQPQRLERDYRRQQAQRPSFHAVCRSLHPQARCSELHHRGYSLRPGYLW